MLLFNTSNSLLFFRQSKTCPHCHSHHYQLNNNSRFLRFAILPIFPLRWDYHYQCAECQHNEPVTLTKLPLFEQLSLLKYFAGVLLLVWLCSYFYTQHHQSVELQRALLAEPKAYDTYLVYADEFANEPSRPENLKVAQVLSFDNKFITFQLSNYRYKRNNAITMAMRTSLLVQDDYFSSKTLTLTRKAVTQLFNEGVIYDVLRPNAYSLYGGFVMFPPRPKPLYEGVKLNQHNQQGIMYYKDKQFKEALENFLLAAKEGSPWGQLNSAQMYRDGEGVEKSLEQALYWYQQAAKQGNHKAKVELNALCSKITC